MVLRKVLVISVCCAQFFCFTSQAAEELSCFGTREATLSAVSSMIDQYDCTNRKTVKACREVVAVGATLGTVAASKSVRAALRLKALELCGSNVSYSPQLLELLLLPQVADALPKTCSLDAQKLNTAYQQYAKDLEKALDQELVERRQGLTAIKKNLDIRLRSEGAAKRYAELENALARTPEKLLGPEWVQTDYNGNPKALNTEAKRFLLEKQQRIRTFLQRYDKLSGVELEKFLAQEIPEIHKGLASNTSVGALLNKIYPSEVAATIKDLEKGDIFEKVRKLEGLAKKYPYVQDLAQMERSMQYFEVEISEFKRASLTAQTGAFSTVEDVIEKFAHVKTPMAIEKVATLRTAQSLRALNVAAAQNLQKQTGSLAKALTKKYGARTIATKGLVFLGSKTVFAADMARQSISETACTDFNLGQYSTTSGAGCEIVDELGPTTREFFMTKDDDKIFNELKKSKKFCESMQRYAARANPSGWHGQCTANGFKLKSLKSKTYLTFGFHTNTDGTIKIGERTEGGQASVNLRFTDQEELLPVKELDGVNDEFQVMNLAVAQTQGCCTDYHNMDQNLCARYGISSAPTNKNSGSPNSAKGVK